MDNHDLSKSGKPIALVCDDEPLILMDTSDMVADEGYDVVEVATAEEAFEFLVTHPSVQLVFTDVQTPGSMTGFELAWKVAERWPQISVVVASGAAAPQEGDLPAVAVFIAKPISAELVHKILRERR